MKKLLISSICLSVLFVSCASNRKMVSAPSVAGVQSNISQAQNSTEKASVNIKKVKSRLETIDFKTSRALKLLE